MIYIKLLLLLNLRAALCQMPYPYPVQQYVQRIPVPVPVQIPRPVPYPQPVPILITSLTKTPHESKKCDCKATDKPGETQQMGLIPLYGVLPNNLLSILCNNIEGISDDECLERRSKHKNNLKLNKEYSSLSDEEHVKAMEPKDVQVERVGKKTRIIIKL